MTCTYCLLKILKEKIIKRTFTALSILQTFRYNAEIYFRKIVETYSSKCYHIIRSNREFFDKGPISEMPIFVLSFPYTTSPSKLQPNPTPFTIKTPFSLAIFDSSDRQFRTGLSLKTLEMADPTCFETHTYRHLLISQNLYLKVPSFIKNIV